MAWWSTDHSASQRSQFVGEVLRVRDDRWTEVEAKNRFAVGDRLEVIHPGANRVVQLDAMCNQDSEAIEVAQGSPTRVWAPLGASTNGMAL